MKDRLKKLRDTLNMNQRDFSEKINISQPALALFENGKRVLKDIHISRICNEFNVNEEWLKNGTGEMFVQPKVFSLDKYALEKNLTPLETEIIKAYMSLDSDVRKSIMSQLKEIFNKHQEIAVTSENYIEKEIENYRIELEAEQKGLKLSALEKPEEKLG